MFDFVALLLLGERGGWQELTWDCKLPETHKEFDTLGVICLVLVWATLSILWHAHMETHICDARLLHINGNVVITMMITIIPWKWLASSVSLGNIFNVMRLHMETHIVSMW